MRHAARNTRCMTSRLATTIGTLTLISAESGRVYDADDLALAEALAGRDRKSVV